jgi:hypothetical protein
VVIHVTNHGTAALVRKCQANLESGLRPLVITTKDFVAGFQSLLSEERLHNRVDVLDIVQFLTANLCERSLFVTDACPQTFITLLWRYNELVDRYETEPGLKIQLPD